MTPVRAHPAHLPWHSIGLPWPGAALGRHGAPLGRHGAALGRPGGALGRLDPHGQGLAEYALILALIVVVAIAALVFLGTQISAILSTIAANI